ncbi:MAG: TIGR01212 family radical SAM protein [Fibromonadales bacterium]|nr:TIGR01212 family radical SAM protein [Fibromonadales bacterium]
MKLYKDFLGELFPQCERVRKVSLNAGLNCPSFCAYCNNSSFSPAAKTELPVLKQLEAGIRNVRKKNCGILAYFQSYTNTNAPVQKLREIFTPVISNSDVVGLAIGTRPDCLPTDVAELLAELSKIKPVIVEIGIQTANDETLKKINRNHTVQCSRDAALLCKNSGLVTTAHIILGLPGENMSDFINTANLVKDCGFSSIKIHPLHIVKGTRFAEEYQKGKIKLLSFEEYCKAAAEVIRIVSPDIAIERISAESPKELLIAPDWGGDRAKIGDCIGKLLDGNE